MAIYSRGGLNKVIGELIANSVLLKILLLVSRINDDGTVAVILVVSLSPRTSDALVRLVKGNIGSSYIRKNTLHAAFARLRA